MSVVTINELAVTVQGNVVKNFDGSESTLRVTQDQAEELYAGLGPVIEFFRSQQPKVAQTNQVDVYPQTNTDFSTTVTPSVAT